MMAHSVGGRQVDAPRPIALIPDPRGEGQQAGVIAFYYPGRDTPWDAACGSRFLGNFYEAARGFEFAPPAASRGEAYVFRNAEAAFQACKFWHLAADFAKCTGHEAFQLKRSLSGREDWTYGGSGGEHEGSGANWRAMQLVLAAKFAPGSALADALLRTGDAFLLEHNAAVGRDAAWSDNGDGSGANWLGAQLMLLRDELAGSARDAGSWTRWIAKWIDVGTGADLGSRSEARRDNAWRRSVRAASTVVIGQFGDPAGAKVLPAGGRLGPAGASTAGSHVA